MLPCFVAQYSGCQLRTIRKSLTSRTQVYKPHSKKARIWICNRGERGGHLLCWPPCPKEIAQHRGKRRPPFQAADSRFEVDLRRKEHYEAIDWHPVPAKELNLMFFFSCRTPSQSSSGADWGFQHRLLRYLLVLFIHYLRVFLSQNLHERSGLHTWPTFCPLGTESLLIFLSSNLK